MTAFIFTTREGYTFQPNSAAIEPDIENLQVLGIANGETAEQAFVKLLSEASWLLQTSFDQVQCFELAHQNYQEHVKSFSIKAQGNTFLVP